MLLALSAFGCGTAERDPSRADSGVSADFDARAKVVDAAPMIETLVSGNLDGVPFTLRFAAVQWEAVTKLCVADVPITALDCGFNNEPKTLLYGWFEVTGETAIWGFPQVEIRRIGTNAAVELSTEGWLTAHEYAPATERFSASFELVFDSGLTGGTIVVP